MAFSFKKDYRAILSVFNFRLLFILVATLLMLQPDLGQTILLFITILCLVFVQGFPWVIIAPAGLISISSEPVISFSPIHLRPAYDCLAFYLQVNVKVSP